jgi:hypothetical protein
VAPHDIENDTKHDRPAKHQNRPIHADKRNRNTGRKEAEHDRDSQEAQGENINSEAHLGAEFPRTPADFFGGEAFGGDQGDGDEVAAEESSDSKGDYGVESDAGGDIDEADNGSEGSAEKDGVERDGHAPVTINDNKFGPNAIFTPKHHMNT